jgi:teichuronic acid biosynthesis glycosyltransferase TuaC
LSRLRVLMITNMYPSQSNPARGIFVKQLVEKLKKYHEQIEIDLLKIEGNSNRFEYLKAIWRVYKQIRQRRYDLIHAHYGLSGLAACFQVRLPLVVTYHGSDLHISWQSAISRWVAQRAAMNIVVSRELAEKLRSPRSIVIPCGVDINLFSPMEKSTARKTLGLDPSKQYVLFPGCRNRAVKNFPLFLKAFEIVRRERPEVEMLELDGTYPHEEIPFIMNAADALVCTSHHEGSPQTIKEAMACNLPIVSVDVGDVRELLQGVSNSYICSRDPQDIARCLKSVLENGERSDGRKRILELQLDSDSIATRVLDVYHQVIKEEK